MSTKDFTNFKKYSLLKHFVKLELQAYHRQKKSEEKTKVNDFVIPMLSAFVSILIWYYANEKYDLENALYIALLIGALAISFILLFLFFSYVCLPLINRFYNNTIRNYFVSDKDEFYQDDLSEKVEYFNYFIVNQVSLSNSLLNNLPKDDKIMKEFLYMESFYYIYDSLHLFETILNVKYAMNLFVPNGNNLNRTIKPYRVYILFHLLKKDILKISNEPIVRNIQTFWSDNQKAIIIYNQLAKRLNKIFNKIDSNTIVIESIVIDGSFYK